MKRKVFLAVLIVSLCLCGCGASTETQTDIQSEETDNETEEVTEEAEVTDDVDTTDIAVTAEDLFAHAFDDVESVKIRDYSCVDIMVSRDAVAESNLQWIDNQDDILSYINKYDHLYDKMKDGSEHLVDKHYYEPFEFDEKEYNDVSESYYDYSGDNVINYTQIPGDAGSDIWGFYTFDKDTDESSKFFWDEPRNLEITDETDDTWIVTGTVDSYKTYYTYDFIEFPEDDSEVDWGAQIDMTVTYTFDKATGHLLRADYDLETVFKENVGEDIWSFVTEVNEIKKYCEFTDFDAVNVTIPSEIKENAIDLDERYAE